METLAQVLPRLYHEFVHYAIKYYAQYPRPTTLYVGFRFVQPLTLVHVILAGGLVSCWARKQLYLAKITAVSPHRAPRCICTNSSHSATINCRGSNHEPVILMRGRIKMYFRKVIFYSLHWRDLFPRILELS